MALVRSVTEDPIPIDNRVDILSGLWQKNTIPTSSKEDLRKWDAYFHFYTSECRKAVEYDYGEHTTVRQHKDILAIANDFANGASKKDIKEGLLLLDTQRRNEDIKIRMAEGSARLVVRLISMVDIGPIPHDRVQGHAPLPWHNEQLNLKALLHNHFSCSFRPPDKLKFHEDFTAFNIRRFAGLEIQWTNNLIDHLRLIENDTRLCIFHHVTFLKCQER